MKVHELLTAIQQNLEQHEDFLDYDIYTEQLTFRDKMFKRGQMPFIDHNGDEYIGSWDTMIDMDGWEYFKTAGFNTTSPRQKIFTINVNY